MNEAKIRLSPAEMELVINDGLILTKNRILTKVMQFLGQLQQEYQQLLSSISSLREEVLSSSPKISRGENYKGLPWLVLDYPRCFGPEDVFAVRTMFWWGQFFSITLHLSGLYKREAEKKITGSFEALAAEGFFVCISESPWQHHFESDNYCSVAETGKPSFEQLVLERPFIKLALKFPLREWDTMYDRLPLQFKKILTLITD